MNIGVFGTGMVGTTIASKLVWVGHDVKLGARSATNEKAAGWARGAGMHASHGTFEEAAAFGELLFNCTSGAGSLDALKAAGDANLANKILIDVSNPLDFSKGFPPTLSVSNTDSLGEQIQRAFPKTKVVKTLNTVNAHLMVEPTRLAGGDHDLFLSGNDAAAKREVDGFLRAWFGWKNIIDVGDITTARGTEQWLAMWVRLYGALGSAEFNLKIVH